MTRSWNDEVRRAIRATGLPLYRLARQAGLSIGPLQRFMEGHHGMTLVSAEKLGPIIGLELRPMRAKNSKKMR